MTILAGYTSQTDGSYVVIGTYETAQSAEDAIAADQSQSVDEYWIASSVNPENNVPIILGTIDV